MEGKESTNHWLRSSVHAEGPLVDESDIRTCLVPLDLRVEWRLLSLKRIRGWGGVVWQRPAQQEHLSVLFLALCSSTQLYRACMRRGADYHQPDQPAKVSLEHDHTQPLSLTPRWRWDKHAPLACVLIPWHLPPLSNPDLQNKLNSRTCLARSQEWSANVRAWTCTH